MWRKEKTHVDFKVRQKHIKNTTKNLAILGRKRMQFSSLRVDLRYFSTTLHRRYFSTSFEHFRSRQAVYCAVSPTEKAQLKNAIKAHKRPKSSKFWLSELGKMRHRPALFFFCWKTPSSTWRDKDVLINMSACKETSTMKRFRYSRHLEDLGDKLELSTWLKSTIYDTKKQQTIAFKRLIKFKLGFCCFVSEMALWTFGSAETTPIHQKSIAPL